MWPVHYTRQMGSATSKRRSVSVKRPALTERFPSQSAPPFRARHVDAAITPASGLQLLAAAEPHPQRATAIPPDRTPIVVGDGLVTVAAHGAINPAGR